jgi:hypothetical protein
MAESERLLSVDDEDLETLFDNKDSKNTKTCIKSAVNILTIFVVTASMEAKISFLQFPQVLPASVAVEQHEIYKYFVL